MDSREILSSANLQMAERVLRAGDHHLLLVPAAHTEPTHALVCVISGEPGKEDVLFAGRFLRHLGAQCTLLSVLPFVGNNSEMHDHTEKFLKGGIRTLEVLGVPAKMAIRSGNIRDEIKQQMDSGGSDLLVLGAPLTYRKGQVSLEGVVGQVIKDMTTHPVLIVRSHYAAVDVRPMTSEGRINIVEKIIP